MQKQPAAQAQASGEDHHGDTPIQRVAFVSTGAMWLQSLIFPALLLLLGWFLNQRIKGVGRDAAATRDQVQNTHTTNLREDLDLIRQDISQVHGEVRGAREDITGLHADDEQQRSDIRALRRRMVNLESAR